MQQMTRYQKLSYIPPHTFLIHSTIKQAFQQVPSSDQTNDVVLENKSRNTKNSNVFDRRNEMSVLAEQAITK